MTSDLPKIWRLFTPRERRRAGWMLLLLVLMAVAETAGVLSIMPFLSVLARPEVVQESPRMQAVYTRLNFASPRDFIAALGIGSIVLVIVASAFKTVTQHVLNRYVHFLRLSISSRLLSRYLHQPYEFFLGRNSAELSKNVLSETDQLVMQMIHPLSLGRGRSAQNMGFQLRGRSARQQLEITAVTSLPVRGDISRKPVG